MSVSSSWNTEDASLQNFFFMSVYSSWNTEDVM